MITFLVFLVFYWCIVIFIMVFGVLLWVKTGREQGRWARRGRSLKSSVSRVIYTVCTIFFFSLCFFLAQDLFCDFSMRVFEPQGR